jgi:hypothetical protein
MIDAVEINDRSLHFMNIKLPKIIATSVVRGSQKGESHGGIFTLDFASQRAEQHVDWDTGERIGSCDEPGHAEEVVPYF